MGHSQKEILEAHSTSWVVVSFNDPLAVLFATCVLHSAAYLSCLFMIASQVQAGFAQSKPQVLVHDPQVTVDMQCLFHM